MSMRTSRNLSSPETNLTAPRGLTAFLEVPVALLRKWAYRRPGTMFVRRRWLATETGADDYWSSRRARDRTSEVSPAQDRK